MVLACEDSRVYATIGIQIFMTIQERMAEAKYFSPTQAAEIIGVCVETVLVQLRTGRLKGTKFGNTRLWRIDPQDLAAFMKAPNIVPKDANR